ncbi:MAG: hypothetical protein ACYC7J_14520 [Syntrophales bacterium]
MLKRIFASLLTILLIGCSDGDPKGPRGVIDRSFNPPAGYVLHQGAPGQQERGVETALQPDGRIVVMGYRHNGLNNDILLLRYHPDGTLDASFGAAGAVVFDVPGSEDEKGMGLALQPDGRIVVAGYARVNGKRDVLVARLTAAGGLDGTFGTGGYVTYAGPGDGTDIAFGVAVQADGRIVVVGEALHQDSQDALLLRFNRDGSLDGSFGTGGVFTYNGGPGEADKGFAAAIAPDGGIVLVGSSIVATREDALVLKVTKDGRLDTSFGAGGVVTYSGPGDESDYGNAVALAPDGRIVIVGASSAGSQFDILVLRLTADGRLDRSFAGSGATTFGHAGDRYDYAWGLAIQPDGKLLLAGATSNGTDNDALILRYLTDGTLDGGFASGGVFTFAVPGSREDSLAACALEPGGRIVAAGYANDGQRDGVLVIRVQ